MAIRTRSTLARRTKIVVAVALPIVLFGVLMERLSWRPRNLRAPVSGPSNFATALSWSTDGKLLAVGGVNGSDIQVWGVQERNLRNTIRQRDRRNSFVEQLALSPDGKMLAVNGARHYGTFRYAPAIELYEVQSGQLLRSLAGQHPFLIAGTNVVGVRHESNRNSLSVAAWSLNTYVPPRVTRFSIPGYQERPDGAPSGSASGPFLFGVAALSANGRRAVVPIATEAVGPGRYNSVFSNAALILFDVANGRIIKRISMPNKWSGRFALSHDGLVLAQAVGGAVRLWETNTGQRTHTIRGNFWDEDALAFSPDSSILAVGHIGTDLSVELLDVRSGQRLRKMRGFNKDNIRNVCFAPDGRTLAVAAQDGTVDLWRVR